MTVNYEQYFKPFLSQRFDRFVKHLDNMPIPPIISSGLPIYEARKLFKTIGRETWLSYNENNSKLMQSFHEYMNTDENKTAIGLKSLGPTAPQPSRPTPQDILKKTEVQYFDAIDDLDDSRSTLKESKHSFLPPDKIDDKEDYSTPSQKIEEIEYSDFTSSYLSHNNYGLPSQAFTPPKNIESKPEDVLHKNYTPNKNKNTSQIKSKLSLNCEPDPFEFFSFNERQTTLNKSENEKERAKVDLDIIEKNEDLLSKTRRHPFKTIPPDLPQSSDDPFLTYWEKWKIQNNEQTQLNNKVKELDSLKQIEANNKWSSHYEYLAGNQHQKDNQFSPLMKEIDIQLNAFAHKDFSSISKLILVENSAKKSSIERAFNSLGYIADHAHPYSQTNEDSYQSFAEINADCTTVFKNYLYNDISVGDNTFKAGEFVQEIYRIIIDNISQSMVNFRQPKHFPKIIENQSNNQKFLTSALFQLYEALNIAEKSTQEPSEYSLTTYPAVFKELVFYVSELFNISEDLKKNTDKQLGMVNDEILKVDEVLKSQQSSLIQIHQLNNQYVKNFHLLLSYLQNDTHSYNDISLKAEVLTANIPRAKNAMSTQLSSLHSSEFCSLFAPKAYENQSSAKSLFDSTKKKRESYTESDWETVSENSVLKVTKLKKKF